MQDALFAIFTTWTLRANALTVGIRRALHHALGLWFSSLGTAALCVLAGSFPLLPYACLRVCLAAFVRPAPEAVAPLRWNAETPVVLLLSVLGTLGLGLGPSPLLRAARETAVAVL